MEIKIDVIIPHINKQELLNQCLQLYKDTCDAQLTNVIVIDNGSTVPLTNDIFGTVIRYENNLGMIQTLLEAKKLSKAEILIYNHSDMFIYEKGWDKKVYEAFCNDSKLGLLGVVGASVAADNGGRSDVLCSFRGGHVHGIQTPAGCHYVALLDGCCMMFRRAALDSFTIDETFYPHHFYDKDWSLEVLTHGWHVAVIDMDCQHLNGQVANAETYQKWATDFVKEKGIDTQFHGDLFFYYENEKKYLSKWKHLLPIIVNKNGGVKTKI